MITAIIGRPAARILFSPLERASVNRVGRLRGYGNAIVPEVAAAFVTALLEAA